MTTNRQRYQIHWLLYNCIRWLSVYCTDRSWWHWRHCEHFHEKRMGCLMLLMDFGSGKCFKRLGTVFFFFFFSLEGVSSKHTALKIHVKMCSKITKEVHGTTESDIVVALITYLLYLISKKKTHTTQAVSLQFSHKEVPMQCGSGQGCAAEIKRPLHSCVERPKVQGGVTWYFSQAQWSEGKVK